MCQKLNISIMVEDKPNTCKILSENGIQAIYMRDNDNEVICNPLVHEVKNWAEAVQKIIFLTGNKGLTEEEYKRILIPQAK